MKRSIYNKLQSWKVASPRLPLILKGARQVGKTYLLKQFATNEFQKFHYVNFEEDEEFCNIFSKDLTSKRIMTDLQFKLNEEIDTSRDLIIFDEIQACPRALTALKYFAETVPELAICCAGSLLGTYLNTEASFPVGKVTFLNLYPFSFIEFIQGIQKLQARDFLNNLKPKEVVSPVVHNKIWELFLDYLIVGGMPSAILAYRNFLEQGRYQAFKAVRKVQKNLFQSYIADIAKHSGKNNSLHIEKVLKNVASQLGQSQNGKAKKFIFKKVLSGKVGYRELSGPIHWLEKAGLVLPVKVCNKANLPLEAYTKENSFKLFFFDVGLLGMLAGISEKSILDYNFKTYKGFFVENFVIQELISVDQWTIYSWAEGKSEIDFLLESGEQAVPIEVKSGANMRARSLAIFSEKYKPKVQIILSGANHAEDGVSRGVYKLPLYMSSQMGKFC
ncbi:AAA family ATPase [Bdellovibrionales bacterium]|nr:AAA family ATPase [Bdellovibrionales bacterium]